MGMYSRPRQQAVELAITPVLQDCLSALKELTLDSDGVKTEEFFAEGGQVNHILKLMELRGDKVIEPAVSLDANAPSLSLCRSLFLTLALFLSLALFFSLYPFMKLRR